MIFRAQMNRWLRSGLAVLPAAAALVLNSCRHADPPLLPGETLRKAIAVDQKTLRPVDGVLAPAGTATTLYAWHGDGMPGALSITIDLSEQKATLYRDGKVAGWTYVATGKSGFGTRTGSFRITEKVRDKHSTLWGKILNSDGRVIVSDARAGRDGGGRFVGAPMPYWMRLYGAVGLHAGPIPSPGDPASHGCIRLPRGIAPTLFQAAQIGTPVTIVP